MSYLAAKKEFAPLKYICTRTNTFNHLTQELSQKAWEILDQAYNFAIEIRSDYFTPEHVLYTILSDTNASLLFNQQSNCIANLKSTIMSFISNIKIAQNQNYQPKASKLLIKALENARKSTDKKIDLIHIIYGIYTLDTSFASYLLHTNITCPLVDILTFSSCNSESIS